MKKQSGFTLIELLIVIGIIAILAGIVIIAVNPTKQFGQANDAQRTSDVNAILNAVSQYAADNRGAMPTGVTLTTSPTYIESSNTSMQALCTALVPSYISALPYDPTGSGSITTTFDGNCVGGTWHTGYQISSGTGGRLTVTAPFDEQADAGISITR